MPETPQPPAEPRHVFVYGTLRRGGVNDIHRYAPPPRFVGTARIEGVMHHLGAYPGVRLQPGAWVEGEVYAIAPPVEALLDVLEMVAPEPTGEYFKRELPVDVDGRRLSCIVYEISPGHSAGKPVIPSGDWMKDGHR